MQCHSLVKQRSRVMLTTLLACVLAVPAMAGETLTVEPGSALTASMLEELIQRELGPPGEGSWTVRIVEPALPLSNSTSSSMEIRIGTYRGFDASPDAARTRIEGDLDVRGTLGASAHLGFAAELRAMVAVPVPLRPIAIGSPIDPSMLGTIDVPRDRLDDDAVRSTEELGHYEVAKRLSAGRAILRSSLQAPRAVRRGEPLLISFVRGGLRLTVTGKALEDAALGETVRASNPASSREVQGVVVAPGEVVIGTPAP